MLLLLFTILAATPQALAQTRGTEPDVRARSLNPDIGVNFLGVFQESSRGGATGGFHDGFNFQEAELQFTADVDPYFRGVALFSIEQEAGENGEPAEVGIDPEEVYLETLTLPFVTVRAGEFRASFTKHNLLHEHAYPFIDQPLINQDLLGEEGLSDLGVGAGFLVPVTWFFEVTLQAIQSANEGLYASPASSDTAGVLAIRNLFDVSDAATLELGLYGTAGENGFGETAKAAAADLVVKWRPTEGGRYRSLVWWTQYMYGNRAGNPSGEELGGLASWLQYQFAQRWWIQLRAELEGIPRSDLAQTAPADTPPLPHRSRQSLLLGLFPSEFSALRLQYDHTVTRGTGTDHRVALQWNFSIGAHPAHAY